MLAASSERLPATWPRSVVRGAVQGVVRGVVVHGVVLRGWTPVAGAARAGREGRS